MANAAHLEQLRAGHAAWGAWRRASPSERPDLSDADLRKVDIGNCDLSYADLRSVNLRGVDCGGYFIGANLAGADLSAAEIGCGRFEAANLTSAKLYNVRTRKTSFRGANLEGAALSGAEFDRADLSRARLTSAELAGTIFTRAHLNDCDITRAKFSRTIFFDTELRGVKGLESCIHHKASAIDWATMQRSGPLPRIFLESSGWPSDVLDYLLPLLSKPILFQSCFISHSAADHDFVDKLESDLASRGIGCWYAPKSLTPGAYLRDSIDEAIRLYDRVIVVLSRNSLRSQWVEAEVESALARERAKQGSVLVPITIDTDVLTATTGWPAFIKNTRHIADFTGWNDAESYAEQFERLRESLRNQSLNILAGDRAG